MRKLGRAKLEREGRNRTFRCIREPTVMLYCRKHAQAMQRNVTQRSRAVQDVVTGIGTSETQASDGDSIHGCIEFDK